jgi:rubrerythrin
MKHLKKFESYFDEIPEPELMDENEFEDREREPFTKSEKLFINKLQDSEYRDSSISHH